VEVAAPEALGSVLVELPVAPVVLLVPLVLWSVVAGCEYEGVELVLPLVEPVAAPLWSELVVPVLLGVAVCSLVLGVVELGVAV
jgi:hypothetical protein